MPASPRKRPERSSGDPKRPHAARQGPSGTSSTVNATSTSTSTTTSSASQTSSSPAGTTNTSKSSSVSVVNPTSASVSSVSLQSITSLSAQSILSVQSTESTASATSLASATSSTTFTTSVIASTVYVTNGVTITTNIAVPTTTTASGTSSNHSSSNVGPIVGGVVGGVVGLAILAVLGWFCWRRKKRSDFDGNFDPDRNIQRPATLPVVNDLDLAAGPSGVDTSPRPFSVGSDGEMAGYSAYHDYPGSGNTETPTTMSGGPAMSQYSGYPLMAGAGAAGYAAGYHGHPEQGQGAPSVVSSGSVYPETRTSASGGGLLPGQRMSKQQEAQAYNNNNRNSVVPAPARASVSPAPGSGNAGSGSGRSGEGYAAGRLAVVNPDDRESGSVLQHRDGGRVVEHLHDENQAEIPPRYDSIPADER